MLRRGGVRSLYRGTYAQGPHRRLASRVFDSLVLYRLSSVLCHRALAGLLLSLRITRQVYILIARVCVVAGHRLCCSWPRLRVMIRSGASAAATREQRRECSRRHPAAPVCCACRLLQGSSPPSCVTSPAGARPSRRVPAPARFYIYRAVWTPTRVPSVSSRRHFCQSEFIHTAKVTT